MWPWAGHLSPLGLNGPISEWGVFISDFRGILGRHELNVYEVRGQCLELESSKLSLRLDVILEGFLEAAEPETDLRGLNRHSIPDTQLQTKPNNTRQYRDML